MQELKLWSPRQQMGRRWPVGCVALEVTQRCNLDCGACYLSESSEALHDLPLEEVFRRIAAIRACYGAGTDVQVTGGDPTLRPAAELVRIVQRIRASGLRATLFTNGIRASRRLLAELAAAGLEAVAFHVDTTQRRKGYASEVELNVLRAEYLERASGLPLAVYFNTTVHNGNLGEVPAAVRFFIGRCDIVRLASFQLLAATGRGVLGARGPAVSAASVIESIRRGAGARLEFDALDIGHPSCNRYAMALVANGRAYDALDDAALVAELLETTAQARLDRVRPWRAAAAFAAALARHPATLARALGWAARKAWAMRGDLVAGRGRVRKLSFFVHNFMDAVELDAQRVAACSFMVASADGPVSMCAHNARRDDYLLQPTVMRGGYWDPVSGRTHARPLVQPVRLTPKNARGRARVA
jgi:7,8-dihydro-6-hydroxymethylpterin dimethyltransferase